MVIGTAGHIDHGKTTLVKALTGVDTDRLPEEKAREISIDLGFAPITLPGIGVASIVDVPGHERFIRNMVAGATGVNVVLLVVAADEGVMPQTREHLQILQLLGVEAGVVAITKVDLVNQDWLDIVISDVESAVAGTFLEGCSIVPVSSITGAGLDELRREIASACARVKSEYVDLPARLPVDRSFTVKGFGTVVTGTLVQGTLSKGKLIELLPSGVQLKIRHIQVHGQEVESVVSRERVAINFTGLKREDVRRGCVVAEPGYLSPCNRFAVKFELLKHAPVFKQNARVRLHLGTAEVVGRMLLLDKAEVSPGDAGLAIFSSEVQAVVARGDRFVMRGFSPPALLGGGEVIITDVPKHMKKREVSQFVSGVSTGNVEALLSFLFIRKKSAFTFKEAANELNLPEDAVASALDKFAEPLMTGEQILGYIPREELDKIKQSIVIFLSNFHARYPLRLGASREEVHSGTLPTWDARLFGALLSLLISQGVVKEQGSLIALPEHEVKIGPELKNLLGFLETMYFKAGFTPPEKEQAVQSLGLDSTTAEEIWRFMVQEGILVNAKEGLYFHKRIFEQARETALTWIRDHGSITVSQFKELIGTSRKYALPLLELMDDLKYTKRVGEVRVPGPAGT